MLEYRLLSDIHALLSYRLLRYKTIRRSAFNNEARDFIYPTVKQMSEVKPPRRAI